MVKIAKVWVNYVTFCHPCCWVEFSILVEEEASRLVVHSIQKLKTVFFFMNMQYDFFTCCNKMAPIINRTLKTKATFMGILDLSMEIVFFFKTNNAKA